MGPVLVLLGTILALGIAVGSRAGQPPAPGAGDAEVAAAAGQPR